MSSIGEREVREEIERVVRREVAGDDGSREKVKTLEAKLRHRHVGVNSRSLRSLARLSHAAGRMVTCRLATLDQCVALVVTYLTLTRASGQAPRLNAS